MEVEFVASEPEHSGEDVIAAGRPRRYPRLVNGALAAVLVAGGVGWYTSRPDASPAPKPPTPTHTTVPSGTPYDADALYGCPGTLACDANHQVQQHMINLIKEKMRERTG